MRVRLPHQLDAAEVRRRLDARKGEIADYFPPGMAAMDSTWAAENRLDFTIGVVGQRVAGRVDIAEDHVVITVDLPFMLAFLGPEVERSVRKEGTRLLT